MEDNNTNFDEYVDTKSGDKCACGRPLRYTSEFLNQCCQACSDSAYKDAHGVDDITSYD